MGLHHTAFHLLVVQGSPGSGKTSIALHRVAYLLYNYRDSLSAEKMLVLIPNRMFLRHISAILPALGERRMSQRTFDDWTLGLLGDKINYEPLETSLETFLDPSVERARQVMLFRNARNKGSLMMDTLIDRHLARLYEQISKQMGVLTCAYYYNENSPQKSTESHGNIVFCAFLCFSVAQEEKNSRCSTILSQAVQVAGDRYGQDGVTRRCKPCLSRPGGYNAETPCFARGNRRGRFSRCHWPTGHLVLSTTWCWETLNAIPQKARCHPERSEGSRHP